MAANGGKKNTYSLDVFINICGCLLSEWKLIIQMTASQFM
jgi:hypothetical protein